MLASHAPGAPAPSMPSAGAVSAGTEVTVWTLSTTRFAPLAWPSTRVAGPVRVPVAPRAEVSSVIPLGTSLTTLIEVNGCVAVPSVMVPAKFSWPITMLPSGLMPSCAL